MNIFLFPLSLLEEQQMLFVSLVLGAFFAGLLSKTWKNGIFSGIIAFISVLFCYLWFQPGPRFQPTLYLNLVQDFTFLSNFLTSFVILTVSGSLGGKIISNNPEIKIQTLVNLENDALKHKLLERKLLTSIQNKVAKEVMVNLLSPHIFGSIIKAFSFTL